jgi:hypothetical protein
MRVHLPSPARVTRIATYDFVFSTSRVLVIIIFMALFEREFGSLVEFGMFFICLGLRGSLCLILYILYLIFITLHFIHIYLIYLLLHLFCWLVFG